MYRIFKKLALCLMAPVLIGLVAQLAAADKDVKVITGTQEDALFTDNDPRVG